MNVKLIWELWDNGSFDILSQETNLSFLLPKIIKFGTYNIYAHGHAGAIVSQWYWGSCMKRETIQCCWFYLRRMILIGRGDLNFGHLRGANWATSSWMKKEMIQCWFLLFMNDDDDDDDTSQEIYIYVLKILDAQVWLYGFMDFQRSMEEWWSSSGNIE